MSLQKIAEYLFPAGNFAQIRANAPDRATYNIGATRDLVQNQPAFMAPFAPAAAATMSLPYDLIQASQRARDKFFDANPTSFGIGDDTEVPIGPSFSDLTRAVAAENPLDSLVQRTQGATLGLVDRLKNAPEFLSDLVFTRISADADKPPLNQFDNITNTGVAGINIDELDDNRSRLLARKEGILNNVNLNKIQEKINLIDLVLLSKLEIISDAVRKSAVLPTCTTCTSSALPCTIAPFPASARVFGFVVEEGLTRKITFAAAELPSVSA